MPQIKTDKQPVTQITMIDAEPGKQAEALSIMTERARFMAHQPGCISISLHRSLDGRRIVNYVQWEAPDLLRAAHQSPEFRKAWNRFGRLTDEIDPHLYEVAEIIDETSLAAWRKQRKGGSVKVRDAMAPNVQICAPQDSIKDAAEAMTALNVGLLPVADGDRLVGMISDRDIATRGVAMSRGPDTPVRDVMTADVKYCFEDQDLEEVTRNMADIQVRRLPVLNRDKQLVGIIALGDIVLSEPGGGAAAALRGISRPGGQHAGAVTG